MFINSLLTAYYFGLASQLKCQPQELKQFPFRLLDWFIHLKDADEFSVMDPKKTITTIALEERKEVAAVSKHWIPE